MERKYYMVELPSEMNRLSREEIARRYLDGAEAWLRKIIHSQLSLKYGQNYLNSSIGISKKIIDHINQKKKEKPGKIIRDIDGTTFDQAIDISTHPKFFDEHFKEPFIKAYPLGKEEARHFLICLKNIRNDVSHGQGCSARQLEQAICYTNDLADSIKSYFKGCSMEKEYNVPTVVRYIDNLGNESHLDEVPDVIGQRNIDWRNKGKGDLYPGDHLVAEVEIDASFDPSEYKVYWFVFGSPKREEGCVAKVPIQNCHVNPQMELIFQVCSNRDWHKGHNGIDDEFRVLFKVLPPQQ